MNAQIYEEAANWLVEFRTGNDPAARKQFDAWVRKSPEHLRAYLEITEIWQDASHVRQENGGRSLTRLIADARDPDSNVISVNVPGISATVTPQPKIAKRRWAAIAASIVVLGAAGLWMYTNRDTYTTPIGEKRTVRLEDGSTIELNSRSTVRVRYSAARRELELMQGQALFRVAQDHARPFIVTTDRTQVRAVGTQFDVYRKASATTVTVLEGRVAIRATQPSALQPKVRSSKANDVAPDILAAAGEQVTIAPEMPLRAQKTDISTATAWTQNRLIFKSTPLSEVAEEFNRYNPRRIVVECGASSKSDSRAASLCDLKISGVYSSMEPSLLVRFLRDQPGVSIEEGGSDIVVRPQ